MRRLAAISVVAVLAAVAAGCGGGSDGGGSTSTAAKNTCAKDQLDLVTPGKLTIATGNPSYPPWDEGDRVCFLHEGQILEEGPPRQIFPAPREERTRRFLERYIEAGRL